MHKSRFIWLLFTAALAAGCHRASSRPLEVGMWYWNSPFVVTDADLRSLKTIGVKTLYVREATFTTDGKSALTEFHEHWQSNPPGIKIVLVYNFDGGMIRHFGTLPNNSLVRDIAAGIGHTVDVVKSHGINPAGIQMDLDCPTRLLGKYAELLVALRTRLIADKTLADGQSFSATALQTWLGSDRYADLARASDFLAPQFYESRTGATIDTVAPIADLASLTRRVEKADANGRPFMVGLATYGHALLYDSKGNFAGMYHGMKPTDALRHPALRYDASVPMSDSGTAPSIAQYAGENVLKLTAVQSDLHGHGFGYHIAYIIPSPEMLERQIAAVAKARAEHCAGIILYRFPQSGDELSIPLDAVADTFAGRAARLGVRVQLTRRTVPWALIGASGAGTKSPASFEVSACNTGTAPTLLAPDGLTVVVRLDSPGIERVDRGSFDEASVGILSQDGRFQKCAYAHADAVLLRKYQLLPRERIVSGGIEATVDDAQDASAEWRSRFDGGFSSLEGAERTMRARSERGG